MTREELEAMTDGELSVAVAETLKLYCMETVRFVPTKLAVTSRDTAPNFVDDYRPVLDAIRGRGMYANVVVRRTGKFSVVIIGYIKRQVEGLGVSDNIGRAVCIAAVLACGGGS